MSILNISAVISDAMDAVDLIVDGEILAEIKSALLEASDQLDAGKEDLPVTPAVSFGNSPMAGLLAENAALARQVVIEAITDMAVGLQGYRGVVDEFETRAEDANVNSVASARQISVATECVGAPDFSTPSQCVAPGGSGSEG